MKKVLFVSLLLMGCGHKETVKETVNDDKPLTKKTFKEMFKPTEPKPVTKNTKDDWSKKLIGHTKAEIKAMLGKPEDVYDAGSTWVYRDMRWEPDSEKFTTLWVEFDKDVYLTVPYKDYCLN